MISGGPFFMLRLWLGIRWGQDLNFRRAHFALQIAASQNQVNQFVQVGLTALDFHLLVQRVAM